jgi:hypothetical protein
LRYSIYRYIDHLISELFIVSSEFWELLDLIFARSFSYAISEYFKSKNPSVIANAILEVLISSTSTLRILFPDSELSQEDAIAIMAHIYLEFPNVIVREFGAEVGMIAGSLGLEEPDSAESLTEARFDDIREKTLIEINRKLKLLKEE